MTTSTAAPAATSFDFGLRFPPLPRTVAEVSRLLVCDEPDTTALAQIITADPTVTATVLRRINSVYYALRGKVSTVQRAVTLLGFQETANIALTAGVTGLRELLQTEEQVEVYRALIWRSLGAAYFTQVLARRARLDALPLAFTVGVLSTTGQFVLLYNKPKAYAALWRANETAGAPSAAVEQMILGVNHAAVAARAATMWNLPPEVGEVIGGYLTPGRLPEPARSLALALSAALAATDQLCRRPVQTPPPPFAPPMALAALAKGAQVAPGMLVQSVLSERERALAFMEAVMDG